MRLSQEACDELAGYAMKFIGEKLLPLYKMIVKQEEPVPQYALKILCAALDFDRAYVHSILQNNLLRDVVRCLYTRTRVGEERCLSVLMRQRYFVTLSKEAL